MGTKYYHLDGGARNWLMPWYGVVATGGSVTAIREAEDAATLRGLSRGLRCGNQKCSGWRKDVKAMDVVTPTPRLPKAIADRKQCLVTSGAQGMLCVRQSFLARLAIPDLDQWLWLGKVVDLHGKPCQDWLTYRFPSELIFRGSGVTDGKRPQTCTVCGECGLVMYWPQVKPHYVLERDLDERPIYTANCHALVVREDVYERLRRAGLGNLESGLVVTRKEPLDGFPAELRVGIKTVTEPRVAKRVPKRIGSSRPPIRTKSKGQAR